MAGLLDALQSDDGLLGLALLSAGAAKPVRTSLGEGLLGGMQLVQQSRNAREERAQRMRMQQMQEQALQMQIKDRELAQQRAVRQQDLLAALFSGSSPSQYGVDGGGISLGGVREPMTPKQAGLGGATVEQIAALKAAGGPDLLEAWKVSQTGLEQKPGSFYTLNGKRTYTPDPKEGINFDGQRISMIPGAAETRAGIAGAVKEAEARAAGLYDLVQGVGPDGKPGYVGTRTGLAETLNRPQMPQAGGPTIDTVRNDLAGGGVQFSSPAVERAVRQAAGMSAPQRPGFVATGQSPQEQASMETIKLGNQAFMKDRYEPALSAGDAAGGILTSVQTARRALSGAVQGWGANQIAAGASFLGTIGVPQAERAATSAQMFEQSAMTRLWETLNSAKGPQTEGDADRASKTYARLQNTPRANAFILDLAEATATRDRMRAEYFRQALPLAQKSGDLQEIDRRWARVAPSIWSMDIMKKWGAQ